MKWSDDEKKFMMRNYGKMTVQDIADHLGRTIRSVTIYASRHGLSSQRDCIHSKYGAQIKDMYKSKTTTQIAKELGITRDTVKGYVKNHKLKAEWFLWSKEEEEYLKNHIDRSTEKNISKKLGRSVASVRSKAYQMGIGTHLLNIDSLNSSQVAEIMGVSRFTVMSWVEKGLLKCRHKNRYVIFTENNLLNFMEKNPNSYKALKCDEYIFNQYDWFRKKRREELEKKRLERWGKIAN